MGPVKTANLPIIPLAKGTVLLPGIILRIPVSGQRTDIPALLSGVYSRAASTTPSQRLDSVHIACIPLNSPFLTQDGQKMITGDDRTPRPKERSDIKPSNATKDDLFGYGVAAKISGVEGTTGRSGEFALLVEGVARIKLDRITQERPFVEGEVTYLYDEGEGICANLDKAYTKFCRCIYRRCCHRGSFLSSQTTITRTFDPLTTFLSATPHICWPVPRTCPPP